MKAGGRRIALYLSGRRHAGENLAELLRQRAAGQARPIQMSDALAANTSVAKEVIRAYCLAHARRKVFELKEDYPAACAVVLEAVGKVYGYEAERALKQYILLRKNSLFFKTEHGAAVGDVLASLIQTCRLNGINAWDYLVTLIRQKAEARRQPSLYLPWNYKGAEAEALAA